MVRYLLAMYKWNAPQVEWNARSIFPYNSCLAVISLGAKLTSTSSTLPPSTNLGQPRVYTVSSTQSQVPVHPQTMNYVANHSTRRSACVVSKFHVTTLQCHFQKCDSRQSYDTKYHCLVHRVRKLCSARKYFRNSLPKHAQK